MNTHEIYEDEMRPQPAIGKILEDVRHSSPTLRCQFRIVDFADGIVSIQELEDDEYVVQSLVYGRVFNRGQK